MIFGGFFIVSARYFLAVFMQSNFQKYDIELSAEELAKFQKFLEIFMQTNAQINLSAIRDEAGIIEKHFVDSIMLAAFFVIKEGFPD